MKMLSDKTTRLLNMLVGGWGGMHILELDKIQILLRPQIPTKTLHEWWLGEADRAEI